MADDLLEKLKKLDLEGKYGLSLDQAKALLAELGISVSVEANEENEAILEDTELVSDDIVMSENESADLDDTRKILSWYEQFKQTITDIGIDLTKPEEIQRIRGYIKPNLDVEPKYDGEIIYPLTHMSMAPDPLKMEEYNGFKRKSDEFLERMTVAGEALEEAHHKKASEAELQELKDRYIGCSIDAQDASQYFYGYQTALFTSFYNNYEANTKLPDSNRREDFGVIETLYRLSCDKLLTVEDWQGEVVTYKLIATDENGVITVSKNVNTMDAYDPFVNDAAVIENIRHTGMANVEGKTYDEKFMTDRHDFYVSANKYRESYIVNGVLNEGILRAEVYNYIKDSFSGDYKRVILNADKYIKETQPLVAPKGLEERFDKVAKELKRECGKNDVVKIRIEDSKPLAATFTSGQQTDYEFLCEWYEKENLHYESSMNLMRLMCETEKNPDGSDKGTFPKEVADNIIPNLAALSRLNTHKLQGTLTTASSEKIKAEVKALSGYPIFKSMVYQTVTQERLLSILEGPGMRDFDRELRTAVAMNLKKAKS